MRQTTSWQDLLNPGRARGFFERAPLPAFDPNSNVYSTANAWWLAELSRLIYRHDVEEESRPPEPRRSGFLSKVGFRQRAFFDSPDTDTQAFLVESMDSPAFAALVFRGTEQKLKDFYHDLLTFPKRVDHAEARVHLGFLEALDSIWKEVSPELDAVSSPVFFAGHSLGAALATLAATRRPPRALYTFGSPLVGNAAFVATLAKVPVFRVVDDSDGVTLVPPEELGFRHAGELHRLSPPSGSGSETGPLAWFRRLLGPPQKLADHAPINYVRRLE
jgi:triacylglycerol lipase